MTRQEVADEQVARARMFTVAAYVVLVVGIIGGAIVGLAVENAAAFVALLAGGFLSALPFLGIAWLLEGQAELMDPRE